MVENSANSVPKDKQRTSKTSKLTLAQTLEILTQSFFMCQEEGIEFEVSEKDGNVTVLIHNVKFVDGVLVPVK